MNFNLHFKLHWFFYFFAFLNIVSIGIAIYNVKNESRSYAELLSSSNDSLNFLDKASEIFSLLNSLSAPGNDIFKTRNLEIERENLNKTNQYISKVVIDFKLHLNSHVPDNDENFKLQKNLDSISNLTKLIYEESESIFKYFSQNNLNMASEKMANMDNYTRQATYEIENLRKQIRQFHNYKLREHKEFLEKNENTSVLISILLILAVLATSIIAYIQTSTYNKISKELAVSKKRILAVEDSSPSWLLTTDENFIIQSANKTAAKEMGIDKSKFINHKLSDFIKDHSCLENIKTFAEKCFLTNSIYNFDFYHERENSNRWKRIYIFPIEMPHGEKLLGIKFLDIHAEKIATEYSRQIQNALDGSAIIAKTDKYGKIIEVNDNFCRISEYSRQELIGKDHRLINSGQHPKSFFREMWKTISSGSSWTGDIENQSKSGKRYFVRSYLTPLFSSNGEIEAYLSIRFDITQQKKLEKQLLEAQTLSKIGSWHFDIADQNLAWTSEHYRIFEIPEPQSSKDLYSIYRSKIHPDDLIKLDQLMQSAIQHGKDFVFNHRVVFEDGKRIKFVQGIGHVNKNSKGYPISISGTCQDLTESTLNHENLKRLVDFNQAIIKSARFSIITTDKSGIITGFNDEAERILEYTSKEVIGKQSPAIFHEPKEVAEKAQKLSQEFNQTVPIGFETFVFKANLGSYDEQQWTYISKSGKLIPVLLNVTALRDSHNNLYGYMGIAKDISDEVQLKVQLEQERLKSIHTAKLASLGEMSAGIAHEINNPLTIISSNSQILDRFLDNPQKLSSKIEAIKKATLRIEKIVSGLKKFSRSSGSNTYKIENLKTLIDEAIIMTQHKFKKFDIKLDIEVSSDIKILCDSIEIEQVLVNLISNSVDAIRELPNKWIQIQAETIKNKVQLRVIDSGLGISQEIEDKLFNPFFTTKVTGEGTGLGLSISKGILDQHKASIEYNRRMNNTCFEILFPLAEETSQVA